MTERGSQLKVGIFMAIGLAAIAAMVVYFGRFGDSVRGYYQIRVEYPNASGILQGAGVLLAGAKVGVVATPPVILPDMNGVYVMLKIYEEVKIPSKSEFTIGSSGLLGDRFIQINLQPGASQSEPIQPGAVIQGKNETGMSEIFDQVGPVVGEAREAITNIKNISKKLNEQVLTETMLKDLNASMANLKTTTQSFADASKRLDSIMDKAEKTIGTGEDALLSAKGAADELKKTITDVRGIVQQVKAGNGALGVLLSDKQTAENLRILVESMRKRGILWYKDTSRGNPDR
ncbi:ABC-type transporter Mla maintaining outer membrane lipid asymmetry [Terrimicrobium sacchariphilum]|uniref:ABC-type transporter Mla maintaining outer membrane lipid asymmetry n=1 Tax=Terrimicrobium sacchariphilum TaxID=690879 RepID=A0A146GA78_TERSA|nr:MlaD family protein [Terrimicrobium sacchariphilum]GAT33707.1 ABC-type transporter Mla maintaining outer membrane lipid asymmetry [Terrimicrobium sacchariphilum]